jgi:hypothetical protein
MEAARCLALQGLDRDGRVIYFGTFSKTLLPALRIGSLVLPASLVGPFSRARTIIDRHSPAVDQAELADFITDGLLERHVRRIRASWDFRPLEFPIVGELIGKLMSNSNFERTLRKASVASSFSLHARFRNARRTAA